MLSAHLSARLESAGDKQAPAANNWFRNQHQNSIIKQLHGAEKHDEKTNDNKDNDNNGEHNSLNEANLLDSLVEPVAKYLTLASTFRASCNLNSCGGVKSNGTTQANNLISATPPPPPPPRRTSDDKQVRNEKEEVAAVLPQKIINEQDENEIIKRLNDEQQQQAQQQVAACRLLSRAALSRAKFAIRSYTIAAAVPKRSRSLVDDAKLDTQRNRQVLDELRNESLGGAKDQLTTHQQTINEENDDEEDEVNVIAKCIVDFPRHISQLDDCNHLLIKYEPELDPTHPGFHDLEYRQRRKQVAQVAFEYKFGDKIPRIEYDEKELITWKTIYLRLKEAYAKYACEQHNNAIKQLEQAGIYSENFVPQLQEVSEFLEKKTGWRLRPVAGLLSARDFLASLAFRVFQTTQYIRHWGNPEHSVEPDCIHELMGHIPMLCDDEFAQFSQELGLASLGASDEEIEKFATLYWFTVEFGLCREQNQLKCYGAGLLSSYGEMEHALESGKPKLKEFIPEETACETYDDSDYQVVYYVARSFDEAKLKIKEYASKHLAREHELVYDPFTCTVRELKSLDQLAKYSNNIRNDLNRLHSAIKKMTAKT